MQSLFLSLFLCFSRSLFLSFSLFLFLSFSLSLDLSVSNFSKNYIDTHVLKQGAPTCMAHCLSPPGEVHRQKNHFLSVLKHFHISTFSRQIIFTAILRILIKKIWGFITKLLPTTQCCWIPMFEDRSVSWWVGWDNTEKINVLNKFIYNI